jgi:hypothetical protein
MVKDGELDSKIVALMEETGVLKNYAEEELIAEQLGI